jgi:hypothetical protein
MAAVDEWLLAGKIVCRIHDVIAHDSMITIMVRISINIFFNLNLKLILVF